MTFRLRDLSYRRFVEMAVRIRQLNLIPLTPSPTRPR